MCIILSSVTADYKIAPRGWRRFSVALCLVGALGCNSVRNGWLDPTVLGNFERASTMEIRNSLTLEDTPPGIPGATYPLPEDLSPKMVEYPVTAGDTLAVEIFELRQRQIPYQAQVTVSSVGYVSLPVVGQIPAAGLTVPEFQQALSDVLQSRGVLVEPDVNVVPIFLQNATYSIFGIGVSAANNAPLRAGTFPIRRPDLRLLEAINQVGGLNEFVTDIFVFRYDVPPWERRGEAASEPPSPVEPGEEQGAAPSDDQPAGGGAQAARDELLGLVDDEQRSQLQKETDEAESLARTLEPDALDPYLWVNGEFVPNPGFQEEAVAKTPRGSATIDTIAPSLNWARLAGETTYRVIRVSAELLRSGDPEVNIVVRAGDVIRVVSGEIGVYYVMGQVNRVGAFAFNAEPVTLKAAIAAAGGLSPLAWPDRCTVYRRIGQREQMIQVDLDRIFAGADADFFIRRGDIVNVGTHPFAPFLQRIRAWTLPNPVNNVGYSFTYARNFADIDSFSARLNPANEPDRFPALFP